MQKMKFTEQGFNTKRRDLMSFDHTHTSELFDDPRVSWVLLFPGRRRDFILELCGSDPN